MQKYIPASIVIFFVCSAASASILAVSPSGSVTSKDTLSEAAIAKNITEVQVTSPLSAVQSNISSATLHTWPADRTLRISKGGSIANTTRFSNYSGGKVLSEGGTFSGTGAVDLSGGFSSSTNSQVFTGTGTVKFGIGSLEDNTVQVAWFGTDLPAAVGSVSTTAFKGYGIVQEQDGATYLLSNRLIIPDHLRLRGTGVTYTNARTMAANDFNDTDGVLIQLGNPDYANGMHWSFGARIENAYIDGRGMATTGIYSSSANENSGVFDTWVLNMTTYGIYFDGSKATTTEAPRLMHSEISNCTVDFTDTSSSSAPDKQPIDTANAKGIYVKGTALASALETNINITKCTVTSAQGISGTKPTSGIYIEKTNMATVINSHVEYCTNGITLDGSNGTLIMNYDGHSSMATDILLKNNPLYYSFINIYGAGATNTIADTTTGKTNYSGAIAKIQYYSSGNNWFLDNLSLFGRMDTSSGTPAYNLLEFYGVDKTLTYKRLGGSIYTISTSDWNASADTDYAPTSLFFGVGHASTTKTPYSDPTLQLNEDRIIVWQPISFKASTATDVPNNSIFRDTSDNVIKIKDNAGVTHTLY